MERSQLLLWMILAPLSGAFINLWLRRASAKVAGGIATLAAAVSFLGAVVLTLKLNRMGLASFEFSLPWIKAGSIELIWGFAFDSLTSVMALVVTGIGSLIHLYSIGYMSEEPFPHRYFAYLNLFLFAMLVLISGRSLPVLFVGWEGVGLCSYLLIGYWYQDPAKAKAGMKAFVVNRIGDAGFLIGMFICFGLFGTLQFEEMKLFLASVPEMNQHFLNVAAFFLFVGAVGKSAQLPLYVWLPDAMAGPTPVSALIHAATMVTAGVYLLARMNFLYEVAPQASAIIAIVGASTALFAATIGLVQRDIKKILAYSTVSQLGYMVLAMGVGAYFAGIFHLMTHAFFKALLFLGAGSVIHGLGGEQDIFNMGGLRKKMPITFWTFTAGVVAICGLPPFSGFFSKDTILFAALSSNLGNRWLWTLGTLASVLTAFYMTRLYLVVFFGDYRGQHHPHESSMVMGLPLILLAIGALFSGFLGVPHGLHWIPNFLEQYLSLPGVEENPAFLTEHGAMWAAISCGLLGIFGAVFMYIPNFKTADLFAKWFSPLHRILENKYWVDELYDFLVVRPFVWKCRFFSQVMDTKVIDGGVLFPARLCRMGAAALSFFQSGVVQRSLSVFILSVFLLLGYVLWGVLQ